MRQGRKLRLVSQPNIPPKIYDVGMLVEVCNGEALFSPRCLEARLAWPISSYLEQEKMLHVAAGRVTPGLKQSH